MTSDPNKPIGTFNNEKPKWTQNVKIEIQLSNSEYITIFHDQVSFNVVPVRIRHINLAANISAHVKSIQKLIGEYRNSLAEGQS